jgi:hypothetical protein
MKKRYLIVLILFISSCDQPSHPIKGDHDKISDTDKISNVTFSVINMRTDNGGQFYDIYLKDTAQIKTLNYCLSKKYKNVSDSYIQINYFNDSGVAKRYFEKQFDNNISDREKDKLFRFYIANYKFNPATQYDSLVFEH